MKLLKQWNDVEKTSEGLMRLFKKWKYSNLQIIRGKGKNDEEIFGFPYTSSSDYAAIWNCQAKAIYRWSEEWRFEALAVSENNDAIAVFEHEDGTDKTLDRMYVIIGKVSEQ